MKEIKTKSDWEHLLIVHGAEYFPDLFTKPIAPARKRWRRLKRLLAVKIEVKV
ncbi:hypothetical protein [Loigolactobacillus backii]|uniref:hypothetical protein n=1 Tax=Loigolactobacillus backii TaxID=375175 RepID=UPI000B01B457|nr:hypothetical protein [Loigolactobacillus backii]